MQSRQASPSHARNRTTGYSDSDWGALEKRLSDTRDLLQDILLHLRRVLENLKAAGANSNGAGRVWRKSQPFGQAPGGQPGQRRSGPAAGARTQASGSFRPQEPGSNAAGASGASQASCASGPGRAAGTDGTGSTSGRRTTFASPGASPGARTGDSAGGRAGAGASSSGSARADRHSSAGGSFAGNAGTGGNPSAGASSFGSARAGGRGQAGSSRQDQAAGDFSWSWRGQGGAASGAASGPSSGKSSDAGPGRASWRERGEKTESSRQAGQQRAQQQGSNAHGQEQRHRTGGPGSGSSYQDYRQRTHKSPLGTGRMTLTQACALLCVVLPCNADDIKIAYRKQARRHHPDLGGDEEMMKSINQAYELALTWCSPVRSKAPTWAA